MSLRVQDQHLQQQAGLSGSDGQNEKHLPRVIGISVAQPNLSRAILCLAVDYLASSLHEVDSICKR